MIDEELQYHRALQDVYKKAMGPWQVGDWVAYQGIVGCVTSPAMVRFEDCAVLIHYPNNSAEVLRIPLPINPRNPERGLVGMLEGEWSLQTPSAPKFDDKWAVVHRDYEEIYFADTPVLALLKALAAQSGVTV
jgi:hypothetical protein